MCFGYEDPVKVYLGDLRWRDSWELDEKELEKRNVRMTNGKYSDSGLSKNDQGVVVTIFCEYVE